MTVPPQQGASGCWSAKWSGSSLRLQHAVRWLPRRLGRLGRHLRSGLAFRQKPTRMGMLHWWLEVVCFLLDVLALGEIYETLADLIKWKTRPLTSEEIAVGKEVFGESLDWARVRIDERAYVGPRQYGMCYVSGYTINSWGAMSNPLLVHELMHVWQYHHRGLVYIPRALRAYHSTEGYNYGGATRLTRLYRCDATLQDLNYEQQGDVVADYYRLTKGMPPQWGFAGMDALPIYRYFIRQLQEG